MSDVNTILRDAIGRKWNYKNYGQLQDEYYAGYTGTVSKEIDRVSISSDLLTLNNVAKKARAYSLIRFKKEIFM